MNFSTGQTAETSYLGLHSHLITSFTSQPHYGTHLSASVVGGTSSLRPAAQ